MQSNLPPRDYHLVRQEQHFRRLGTRNPICPRCGETDPAALTGTGHYILCYEDFLIKKGQSPMENHHPAGQHNDPTTIPILGNDHRILSDLQKEWPETTLRNPNGSPLLQASAAVRGWLDALRILIDRVLGWIPPFLEQLDEALNVRVGPQWWIELGVGRSGA